MMSLGIGLVAVGLLIAVRSWGRRRWRRRLIEKRLLIAVGEREKRDRALGREDP